MRLIILAAIVAVMPLVSAIIPNYNHAKFLEKRLDSVLQQTIDDHEIICLDDASTDNSLEILNRYSKGRNFRLLINGINSGSPFAQWNKGAKLARGKYIWFAESDDFCEPNYLEVLLPELEKNPSVGLVYCQSWLVDENGIRIERLPGASRNFDESCFKRNFKMSGKEACREHLAFRSTIPNASAVLVRKEAFEKAGGADENMRLCGDWFMWVKILQDWDLCYLAEPLNYFRAALSGSQRSAAKERISPLAEWVKVMRFIQERQNLAAKTMSESKYYLAQLWGEFFFRALLSGQGLQHALQGTKDALSYDPLIFTRLPLLGIRQCLRRIIRAGSIRQV